MAEKGIAHEIVVDFRRVCSELGRQPSRDEYIGTKEIQGLGKFSKRKVEEVFGTWQQFKIAIGGQSLPDSLNPEPLKVLFFDIETAPMIVYTFCLFDQNIGVPQIIQDSYVLSFSAMFQGDDKVTYIDVREQALPHDDTDILLLARDLLDEADIVITQNGIKFDQKVLAQRFLDKGIKQPSSFKHIDTYRIAKKHFAFPSYSLEYMCGRFNVKYKKLKHKKFPGFELWKECMRGNREAFEEMALYNNTDVLALAELHTKFIPYDDTVNFNVFHDGLHTVCKCGGEYKINKRKPYFHSNAGRYQRYTCEQCGSEMRGKTNLLSPKKKASLKSYTPKR